MKNKFYIQKEGKTVPQLVRCPKCAAEFDAETIIGHQLEEKYQQEYNRKIADTERAGKKREEELAAKEQALKTQAEELDKKVDEKAQAEIQRREKLLREEISRKAKSDYEVQLQSEKERADEAVKQLQEFKKTQVENERLKRQLESQKQDFILELEKKLSAAEAEQRRKFNEQLKSETYLIAKREEERQEERIQVLQKQLDDQKKLADEMRRKAEQGSQQLQGEIQELAIEQFLKDAFPFDQINEVKKGMYGADIVQIIRNSIGKEVGTILYESKNTQNFGGDWIEKMKSEFADVKADMLVLITKSMPKGTEHIELIDGVWVCPLNEFHGAIRILRESLLRVSEAYSSQENKEGKMHMLYDYLTGGRFADQIKRVITNFNEFKDGYEKEKTAMQKIWKKRDAQLDTVAKNLTDCFTQIQVIGGSEIPTLGSPESELLQLADMQ